MEPAEIRWEGRTAYSPRFEDTYYSSNGGLDETRHVFLDGNDLPRRFDGAARFAIGELGFGTGLNFLEASRQWLARSRPAGRLHFVSCELHPVQASDIARIAEAWPEHGALAAELAWRWPEAMPGFRRVELASGRVVLTLLFGDARRTLPQLEGLFDAWFLDGFSPSRNPALWGDDVLREVARLSRSDATAATYSAAGHVRRALEDAGFATERVPGYGHKRHMTRAYRRGTSDGVRTSEPWFAIGDAAAPDRAMVVGGGLAGCLAAERLSARGARVTLVERATEPASGASGNPAAIHMPVVTRERHPMGRLSFAAFAALRDAIRTADRAGHPVRRLDCGVVFAARDGAVADRFHSGLAEYLGPASLLRGVTASEASERAGISLAEGGLLFETAGILDPRSLCASALARAGDLTRVRFESEAVGLVREEGEWVARDDAGHELARAPVAVLACGPDVARFPGSSAIPLRAVRGQIASVPATEGSAALRTVVCRNGYLTPAWEGRHVIGATFDRRTFGSELRESDHRELVERVRSWSEGLADLPAMPMSGRASVRSETPDRIPTLGPVPDPERFTETYGDLHHGRHWKEYPEAPLLPGLWMSAAHGSRGVLTSGLGAELIASQLFGEPWPIERDLGHGVHPARFVIRDFRRAPGTRRWTDPKPNA